MIKKLAKQIFSELYETYPKSDIKQRTLRQQLKNELIQQAVDTGKIQPHEVWILKSYLTNMAKSKMCQGYITFYNP